MVNEINKPNDSADNAQLGQRLAASGVALAEMQAEHQQLIDEMEQLRLRAEQLQSVRQQQGHVEQTRSEEYEESIEETSTASVMKSRAVQQISSKSSTVQELSGTSAGSGALSALLDEEDADETDYIKQKLAEIAQLKSQFKKVQNMISTTEMIEQHLSKHASLSETVEVAESVKQSSSSCVKQQSFEMAQQSSSSTSTSTSTSSSKAVMEAISSSSKVSVAEEIEEQSITSSSSSATVADEKQQLLSTMLDMFQDFNTDMKSQAEHLRAERERIKALKETIIRSRQESKEDESK